MTTLVNGETQHKHDNSGEHVVTSLIVRRFFRVPVVREIFVILGFCLFTAVLTWPYVTRLRDVVVDKGDPYLITWILWWDYHQTFTDPLHLFSANVFYPLKYTLAFSEHSYGISMLFFPLYALGLPPLTVHAIALFFGFALSGYGAFRLGRTLTGSAAVGWIAGIIFAFIPYRFHMMSQVAYVFSPWLPLVFEALVLFVRERSQKRAAYLGVAFFMSGITTITWFNFSLIPLALFTAILLTRYGLWHDRDFWRRGSVAIILAGIALLPFMIPYVLVSRLYGFKRSIDEIKLYSALPIHWLSVENRNKLWNRMGEGIPDGARLKLFPGLLPIMFSLAAVLLARENSVVDSGSGSMQDRSTVERWLWRLDVAILVLIPLSLLSLGFEDSSAFFNLFDNLKSERMLGLLTILSVTRLCLAYPSFMNARRPNLIATIRSDHRSDAFWLGIVLSVIGFCFSLGWNFFFFRLLYHLLPNFKSIRAVSRGALLTYLGLALLSGIGVKSLIPRIRERFPKLRPNALITVACILLLIELNAAPLKIVRGEPYPDAVTGRLKQTPMSGGIVALPAGGDNNYRYMLRATDHEKPLIVGTSGFNSPIENKIEDLIYKGPITDQLMTLMESVPTSYLVICNQSIPPERTADYKFFLARQLSLGRLRFVNRFDGQDDLYAVVKNEPQAQTEAALPPGLEIRDWATAIQDDPVVLLGSPLELSQRLFRLFVASTGEMPRYSDFKNNLEKICRGVIVGASGNDEQFANNFQKFLNEWMKSDWFITSLGQLDDTRYVKQLIHNSTIEMDQPTFDKLLTGLTNGQESRASVLLKIVDDPRFVEKERKPSVVALHYFGYLRRNPDDPPDNNLNGFNFWLNDIEHNSDPKKLPTAFSLTGEYQKYAKKP